MSNQPGFFRRMDATGLPSLLARLALGLMFLYTGYVKAMDAANFLKLLREYHLFAPESYVWMNLVAITLPWLEVLCGVLLIAGIALRGTSLLVAGMLIPFTVVVTLRAVGIHNAEHIAFCAISFDCGCGTGAVNICGKIAENTGLTLLALLLVWSRTTLSLTNVLSPKRISVR